MKKKLLLDKLEEISYEIREFSSNHTISESSKDLEKLSDKLDNIIQSIEDDGVSEKDKDEE